MRDQSRHTLSSSRSYRHNNRGRESRSRSRSSSPSRSRNNRLSSRGSRHDPERWSRSKSSSEKGDLKSEFPRRHVESSNGAAILDKDEATKSHALKSIPIHPLLQTDIRQSSSYSRSLIPAAATSSVQANIRAGEKSILQKMAEEKGIRKKRSPTPAESFLSIKPNIPRNNPYFDRSLAFASFRASHGRPKKISFVEQGKYSKEAEELRAHEEIEALRREVSESLSHVGIDSEIVVDLLTSESMPTVEWWDAPFVKDSYNNEPSMEMIDNLIQRPALLPPPIDIDSLVSPRPLFLTKKEQKKLRRQRRLAEQKEKQEQIKLGLLPPDAPKTRIANVARLLGTHATQEPSKVEAELRAQAKERLERHLIMNKERSIASKVERAEKNRWQREDTVVDKILDMTVAVFKVRCLTPPQWRFKVTKNAQQYHLCGVALYYKDVNLIVAEGSAADIRRYKHLLLERIKWMEPPGDSNLPSPLDNECKLIWEGSVGKRTFSGFVGKEMSTELDVREFLAKFGLEHYWRIVKQ